MTFRVSGHMRVYVSIVTLRAQPRACEWLSSRRHPCCSKVATIGSSIVTAKLLVFAGLEDQGQNPMLHMKVRRLGEHCRFPAPL